MRKAVTTPMGGRTVIFQHIPKAAGSTLIFTVLMQRFARDRSFICGTDGVLGDFLALPDERRAGLDFLAGHVDFGIHEHLGGPGAYFAFVRDPVERVVSHYFFIRNSPRHRYRQEAQEMDMEAFIASGIRPRMNNCMTRMISGLDAPYGKCPESMLDKAVENLMQDYFFLGIVERFDESLAMLAELLGWRNVRYDKRCVSKGRPQLIELPGGALDVVREYNNLDIELYSRLQGRLPAGLSPQRLGGGHGLGL